MSAAIRLARDRTDARWSAGSVALEFAVTAPLLIGLIVTVVDLAVVLAGGVALQAGVRAASRYGLTGLERGDQTRGDVIRDIVTEHVCPAAVADRDTTVCYWTAEGLPVDADALGVPLVIDTFAYTDPQNVGQPEPWADENGNGRFDAGEDYNDVNGNGVWDADMGRADLGGTNDIVVYNVLMSQRVWTPLLRAAIGETVLHRARMVIRNEPF
ncbi:MAG: TadE/TadG family type IV pilus assembly protein [Pseudomonadota bacterium]